MVKVTTNEGGGNAPTSSTNGQLQATTKEFTKDDLFREFAEAEFALNQVCAQMSNKQFRRGLKAYTKIGMGDLEKKPNDPLERMFVLCMFQLDQIKTMIFALMEQSVEKTIEEKASSTT